MVLWSVRQKKTTNLAANIPSKRVKQIPNHDSRSVRRPEPPDLLDQRSSCGKSVVMIVEPGQRPKNVVKSRLVLRISIGQKRWGSRSNVIISTKKETLVVRGYTIPTWLKGSEREVARPID